MGFYIRKSINVGLFRFNLSKSGIGISTGIKGLRVGMGPRGNYIHMGSNGLYYQKTFTTKKEKSRTLDIENSKYFDSLEHNPNYKNYQEIESADIVQMIDSSSESLLSDFDTKRKKWRIWPIALGLSLTSFFMMPKELPFWFHISFLFLSTLFVYGTYTYDLIRKSVVLFYELDGDLEKVYQKLLDDFGSLSKVSKIWHIEAKADIIDQKRNAGAFQILNRKQIKLEIKDPPYTKTNIKVPCIPVGKQELFLFPDRIIIFENDQVGAVSYDMLNIAISNTHFIEYEKVPDDAHIVKMTWKYVNKSGDQDRRFNDNHEIPICLYEDVHFRSKNGLNELIQLSKHGFGQQFSNTLTLLSQHIRT